MPCAVKLLPVTKGSTRFYDFDEYERLVGAARLLDPRTHLIALRGGDAGQETGGEAGIRTLDTAFRPYNGLANRRLQPLGHLTVEISLTISAIRR